MKDSAKIRLVFFAFALAANTAISFLNKGQFNLGMFVFGIPSLIFATWISGFLTKRITDGSIFIVGGIGAAISLISLVVGTASWFILMSFGNSDALGGALVAGVLGLIIMGIPVGLLGVISGVTAKYVIEKQTT